MSTLNKYGIPMFGQSRAPMKQPKPKWRFRVLFFGFGANDDDGTFITIETNTVTRPSVEHEDQTVHSYNSSTHYKGKYTWQQINIEFRDAIDNASLKALWNQMRKEFNYYSQESRTSASQYKFEMWIQTLDGSNSQSLSNLYEGTLDTWVCQGCYVQNTEFGEGDYSSSEPLPIAFTIQPDGCLLLGPDGNPLGDAVEGNGTPTNPAITSSASTFDSETLADSNFY